MAKNKHTKSTWQQDNFFRKCPKPKCHGTLIHCQVKYKSRGPVIDEQECSDCGLVRKNKFPRNRK